MTTETKLKDEQVICPKCAHQFRAIPAQVQDLLLAAGYKPPFTQPVLQSPEIQALRKDAERYRWLRDSGSDDMGVVTGIDGIDYGSTSVAYTYEDGLCGEQLDKAIDAAMEQKS